ncbi:MAG TPA: TetR/AcrR family transcriptional regulator [Acidimicrobiales bacterium]|nr:TetR/AcrR family transcriptional regulator [Acidimicrobiales bacterium]
MQTKAVEERVQRPSADSTRERILAAALDLFSERSFEGASTRLIAERAGVQQPLLTYHFGNKEELWRSAVGQLFEDLARALSGRVAGLRGVDDETVARLVVTDFVHFSANHPELHRIIMQECKSEGDRLAWLVEQYIRPLYESAVALFEPLVAAGKVRDVPAAHLYYLLTGAVATIFALAPECRLLTGVDPVDPPEVECHVDAVISMLFVS